MRKWKTSCTNTGGFVSGALSLSRVCGGLWRLSRSSQHLWRSQVCLHFRYLKCSHTSLLGASSFINLKFVTVLARQLRIKFLFFMGVICGWDFLRASIVFPPLLSACMLLLWSVAEGNSLSWRSCTLRSLHTDECW